MWFCCCICGSAAAVVLHDWLPDCTAIHAIYDFLHCTVHCLLSAAGMYVLVADMFVDCGCVIENK
jgi:hypothetical protein